MRETEAEQGSRAGPHSRLRLNLHLVLLVLSLPHGGGSGRSSKRGKTTDNSVGRVSAALLTTSGSRPGSVRLACQELFMVPAPSAACPPAGAVPELASQLDSRPGRAELPPPRSPVLSGDLSLELMSYLLSSNSVLSSPLKTCPGLTSSLLSKSQPGALSPTSVHPISLLPSKADASKATSTFPVSPPSSLHLLDPYRLQGSLLSSPEADGHQA